MRPIFVEREGDGLARVELLELSVELLPCFSTSRFCLSVLVLVLGWLIWGRTADATEKGWFSHIRQVKVGK